VCLETIRTPDGDRMSAQIVSRCPARHVGVPIRTAAFTYVPNTGYVGSDSFVYQYGDGLLFGSFATSRSTSRNPAPVANNDSYTTSHDRTLSVSTYNGGLVNDTDADSNP